MKIVNEKGKLFGLINVVDLLVLLALVAIIGGVGYKLFGHQISESVSPTVKMTTVIRIRGTTPFLVSELEKDNQVGKNIVSGNDYLSDAVITDMWFEDYVTQSTTDDGRIVDSVDPSKKDVMFVIESTVSEGTATPKIGTQEVRAGRTYIVKTNTFEVSGNIESVTFGE